MNFQYLITVYIFLFFYFDSLTKINSTISANSKDLLTRSVKNMFGSLKEIFFYDNRIDVLKNISFNAEKGRVTAIVGASGAGKTTLLGLIERFYNVSQGAIYLGNQDLKDIKISSLRSKIAYVSQEGSMFNDSIKNNIMFGNHLTTASTEDSICRKDCME